MNTRDVFHIFRRGIRLRCPKCGKGKLFSKAFTMDSQCTNCHLKFEREQGFFVGAMYINYVVTVFITFGGYFAFDYFTPIARLNLLVFFGILCVLIPVFFFRHSRGLWLSLDYVFNPE